MKTNPFSFNSNPPYFVIHDPRKQFIRRVATLGMFFLLAIFFVALEIRHYHDLYQMSRLVAAAESQTRQLEEQLRLEKAREAALQGILQERSYPGRDSRDFIMAGTLASVNH